MATNAERMENALNYLIREYEQHCLDRLSGKERVTYSLNGRSFQWGEYSKNALQLIKDTQATLASLDIPYAEIRVS